MCPLRFILVFFSAIVAGYVAWRTVRSSSDSDDLIITDSAVDNASPKEKEASNLKTIIKKGFWVFIDMASGRYLWRNLKDIKQS